MIRYKLRELISDKEFRRQKRLTLEEVAEGSGVHRITLSKMLNKFGYRVSLEVVEKLCKYFAVDVGGLLTIVPDQKVAKRPAKKRKK